MKNPQPGGKTLAARSRRADYPAPVLWPSSLPTTDRRHRSDRGCGVHAPAHIRIGTVVVAAADQDFTRWSPALGVFWL